MVTYHQRWSGWISPEVLPIAKISSFAPAPVETRAKKHVQVDGLEFDPRETKGGLENARSEEAKRSGPFASERR